MVSKLVGKAFLGTRLMEICLRETMILRCPIPNSCIPSGEGERSDVLGAYLNRGCSRRCLANCGRARNQLGALGIGKTRQLEEHNAVTATGTLKGSQTATTPSLSAGERAGARAGVITNHCIKCDDPLKHQQ